MLKSSFTLFETLLSVVILLIIVGTILKIPYNKKDNLFFALNELENSFATKEYRNFSKKETNLVVFLDGVVENILVNKFEYKDNDIRVFKYEK